MVAPEAGKWHLWTVWSGWCCCSSYNGLDTGSYYNTVRTDPGRSSDKMGSPTKSNHTRVIHQRMLLLITPFLKYNYVCVSGSSLNSQRGTQVHADEVPRLANKFDVRSDTLSLCLLVHDAWPGKMKWIQKPNAHHGRLLKWFLKEKKICILKGLKCHSQ